MSSHGLSPYVDRQARQWFAIARFFHAAKRCYPPPRADPSSFFSWVALGALPPAAAIAGLAVAPSAPAAGVAATALPPFSLGDGFTGTISHRLVARIRAGEFVDMAELLPDNHELLRREAAMFAEREPQGAPRVRPVLRQIPSILSWARCALTPPFALAPGPAGTTSGCTCA